MRIICCFLLLVFAMSCNQRDTDKNKDVDSQPANEPVATSNPNNDSLELYKHMFRGTWYLPKNAQPVMEVGNGEINYFLVKSRYYFLDLHTVIEQNYEGTTDTLLVHFKNDTLVLQNTNVYGESKYVRTP